jgi:tetratricopeptide (TPR) repeat protein
MNGKESNINNPILNPFQDKSHFYDQHIHNNNNKFNEFVSPEELHSFHEGIHQPPPIEIIGQKTYNDFLSEFLAQSNHPQLDESKKVHSDFLNEYDVAINNKNKNDDIEDWENIYNRNVEKDFVDFENIYKNSDVKFLDEWHKDNFEQIFNQKNEVNDMVNQFTENKTNELLDDPDLEDDELLHQMFMDEYLDNIRIHDILDNGVNSINELIMDDVSIFRNKKDFEEYKPIENNPYFNEVDNYNRGLTLFKNGNIKDAILSIEAFVQQEPGNHEGWKLLGRIHAENDDDTRSIQSLNKSIEINPSDVDSLLLISVSHTNNFNYESVCQVLRKLLNLNPMYKDIVNQFDRPNVSKREAIDLVINLFVKAATLTVNDPDVHIHMGLGVLYNIRHDYQNSAECFKIAIKKCPSDYQLWNKLGATLANLDRFDESLDCYTRALEVNPSYTRARSNLGMCFLSLQNYEEAAKCFLGALTMNMENKNLWGLLYTALMRLGRHDLLPYINSNDIQSFSEHFEF